MENLNKRSHDAPGSPDVLLPGAARSGGARSGSGVGARGGGGGRGSGSAGIVLTLVGLLAFAALAATGFMRSVDSMEAQQRHEALGAVKGTARDRSAAFEKVCAQRVARLRETGKVEKTVFYLKAKFPVERYIKSSFSDEGFTVVSSHTDALFVVGKSTAAAIGWEVCAGAGKHNHVRGQRSMVTKDGLTSSLRLSNSKGAELFKRTGMLSDMFYKPSYAVSKPADCNALMLAVEAADFLAHPQELARPQYIQKALSGGHNGQGLTILTGEDMVDLHKTYQETHRCPSGNVLVQRFLQNPALVEGRTFNLRLFMVVLRTKPALVAYYDGYLRLTKSRFNLDGKDSKAFISNLEKVWKKKGGGGGSDSGGGGGAEREPKHFWLLNELVEYLHAGTKLPAEYQALPKAAGAERYLDEVLRPRIMSVFSHIFRSAQRTLDPGPQWYGVYGADMTLEADTLTPYVFEVNYSPELSAMVPLGAVQNMYPDVVTAEEHLLTNHTAAWEELSPLMRAPERFNVIVDDQKTPRFTYARPDLFKRKQS